MPTLPEFAKDSDTTTKILNGPSGHKTAAGYIKDHAAFVTSETAVRRWRAANGWKAPDKPPADVQEPDAPKDVEDVLNPLPEHVLLDLRRRNNRLSAALAKMKISKDEYVAAVYEAVRDSMGGLIIKSVAKPATDRRTKREEVAAALLSDVQLAKVTVRGDVDQYNSPIAERRVDAYADKIIEITNIQRQDHPVRKIVVGVLGDIIEGEEIFPGQVFLIDGGLYRQITVDGPRIIVNFLRKLLANFEEVEVFWVIGNHGRIGGTSSKNHDPETNGDRMLGRIVQMLLQPEIDSGRISFTIPDGRGDRNWYTVAEIGNYSALLIHGDQIRGHSGFPWYGLGKKVNGWASGAIPENFQDVWMGHWHQIASIPLNSRHVYVNGSTESYNQYAAENLAAQSEAAQWLLFVNPERGRVTGEYKVWLEGIE